MVNWDWKPQSVQLNCLIGYRSVTMGKNETFRVTNRVEVPHTFFTTYFFNIKDIEFECTCVSVCPSQYSADLSRKLSLQAGHQIKAFCLAD